MWVLDEIIKNAEVLKILMDTQISGVNDVSDITILTLTIWVTKLVELKNFRDRTAHFYSQRKKNTIKKEGRHILLSVRSGKNMYNI